LFFQYLDRENESAIVGKMNRIFHGRLNCLNDSLSTMDLFVSLSVRATRQPDNSAVIIHAKKNKQPRSRMNEHGVGEDQ